MDPDTPGFPITVNPSDLERYLHEHIPLTAAMGVIVEVAGQGRIVLRAPLDPNINHRDTVFGGSASALAILACWALVHLRMRELGHSPRRIVIQRNSMEYERPIEGEFTAECRAPDAGAWDRFLRILERRGIARIGLEATLHDEGVDGARSESAAGRFEGAYVVMEDGKDRR
ncbi:MAG: YiiD C-terminal domain-containing protein [Longimicrobiales bacterium]